MNRLYLSQDAKKPVKTFKNSIEGYRTTGLSYAACNNINECATRAGDIIQYTITARGHFMILRNGILRLGRHFTTNQRRQKMSPKRNFSTTVRWNDKRMWFTAFD